MDLSWLGLPLLSQDIAAKAKMGAVPQRKRSLQMCDVRDAPMRPLPADGQREGGGGEDADQSACLLICTEDVCARHLPACTRVLCASQPRALIKANRSVMRDVVR